MELIKPGINIDFVGKRKLAFAVSGILILMTVVSLLLHGGPNYGIDFAGGILVQVKFKAPTDAATIKKAMEPLGMSDALVQAFGRGGDEFLIRVEKTDRNLENLSDSISKALKTTYKDGFTVRRVEMVGPKVGKDLRKKALLAIFFAILMIAVYISGRFEAKWGLAALMAAVLAGATFFMEVILSGDTGQDTGVVALIVTALVVTVGACWLLKLRYALGAIVALIHDVVITVGVFSVLNKEVTLATVAALLTIIGYSLNDTIIVFDRIRENLKKGGRRSLDLVINDSVNQTLSRTILTSGTTLIVLICLYVLGGGVIEDFALAMIVGVVVGTYSSIYVASPIILLLPEGKPSLLRAKAPETAGRPAPKPKPKEVAEQEVQEPGPAPSAAKASASRKRSKGRRYNKRKKR